MTTGNVLAEALKPFIAAAAPGWIQQFGVWRDSGGAADRFVVVQPMGGPGAGQLVRRPVVSVRFISAKGDGAEVWSLVAESFAASLRAAGPSGVAYAEATEPVPTQTTDGRVVAEVVVSSIVSL